MRGTDGFAHLYDEIRAIADSHMGNERPGHTLSSTALVHEAFLRLRDRVGPQDKTQFLAWVGREMRRILVDHARRRTALRRGGGLTPITLNDEIAGAPSYTLDLLILDEALTRLKARSDRQGQVVELRLFGGLTVEETADVLEISSRTVKNDFRFAIAWLRREMGILEACDER